MSTTFIRQVRLVLADQIDQHSEHGQDALPIACSQLARDSDTRQLLHDELEHVILDQFDALAAASTRRENPDGR